MQISSQVCLCDSWWQRSHQNRQKNELPEWKPEWVEEPNAGRSLRWHRRQDVGTAVRNAESKVALKARPCDVHFLVEQGQRVLCIRRSRDDRPFAFFGPAPGPPSPPADCCADGGHFRFGERTAAVDRKNRPELQPCLPHLHPARRRRRPASCWSSSRRTGRAAPAACSASPATMSAPAGDPWVRRCRSASGARGWRGGEAGIRCLTALGR